MTCWWCKENAVVVLKMKRPPDLPFCEEHSKEWKSIFKHLQPEEVPA